LQNSPFASLATEYLPKTASFGLVLTLAKLPRELPLLKRKSEEDVFLTLHSILHYCNFFDVLVLGL
jgi:hypothetical protein